MVTDFQHKSSTLQCSGEHCQCVQYISSSCYVKWRNRRFLDTIVQYCANTLASQLKIVFIIISWFLNTEITRGHSWSFVVTRGHSWSLVVTRGHSWSLVVTRGHSWSLVVIRGHSWSLVCTFRQDRIEVQKFRYICNYRRKMNFIFNTVLLDLIENSTRVRTRVNTNEHEWTRMEHEWTRMEHEWTRMNTSKHEWNTSEHEWNTSEHEWNTSEYEWNTSPKRLITLNTTY
jgi:hypothetical protein